MLWAVLCFVATGALLIALAIPLMRRRIKPNGWYGLRVPATFADEGVWYDANARSGRDLAIVGGLQIVLALSFPLFDSSDAYVIVNATVLLLATILLAIAGWTYANRLLRERNRGAVGDLAGMTNTPGDGGGQDARTTRREEEPRR